MKGEQLRRILEDALSRGKVYIHVNALAEGVDLPQALMGRERVPLVVAWRAPDINLDLGEDQIMATLRFSSEPYRCVIPWGAVLAVIADHPIAKPQEPSLHVVQGGSDKNEESDRERPGLKLIRD
jgi:stringent starvation protein B